VTAEACEIGASLTRILAAAEGGELDASPMMRARLDAAVALLASSTPSETKDRGNPAERAFLARRRGQLTG
jgi:hypothetical protein